jgi:hypothetical protein
MKRTIRSLSENEFNILIKKMENYEGWHLGFGLAG